MAQSDLDKFMAKYGENTSPKEDSAELSAFMSKYGVDSAKQAFETGQSGSAFYPDDESQPAQRNTDLSGFAKGAIEGISTAGAVAGGMIGGSAAGAASMGLGAPAGAVAGATIGGIYGQVVENFVKDLAGIKDLPKTIGEGAEEVAKGAVEGVAMEVGGQVANKALGGIFKATGKFLKGSSKVSAGKAIPMTKSNVARATRGGKSLDDLGELMMDEGVMNTPGTLKMVKKRLAKSVDDIGKELQVSYGKLDKVADKKVTGKALRERMKDIMMKTAEEGGDEALKSELKLIDDKLDDFMSFSDDKIIDYEKMWKMAKKIEKGAYGGNADLRSPTIKVARTLRETLEEFAKEAGPGSAEVMERITQQSSKYGPLKTAFDAAEARLNRSPTVFGRAMRALSYMAGKSATGDMVGPAVVGALEFSGSTLGKTSAATLKRLGGNILSNAGKLGSFGNEFVKLASRAGAAKANEAVAKRHAYLMLNNKKYRELYQSKIGQETIEEDKSQIPQE